MQTRKGNDLWNLFKKFGFSPSETSNVEIVKKKEIKTNDRQKSFEIKLAKLDDALIERLIVAYGKMLLAVDAKQTSDSRIYDFGRALFQVRNDRKEGVVVEEKYNYNNRIIYPIFVDVCASKFEALAREGKSPLLEAQNQGLEFGIITNRVSNMLAYATADAWERYDNVHKAARATRDSICASIDFLIDALSKN